MSGVVRALSVLTAIAVAGGPVVSTAGGSATGMSAVTVSAAARMGTAGRAGASAAQVNAARRALAVRVARRMFEGVRLPAGARRLSKTRTDATGQVSRPDQQLYVNASVTRTRFYRTAAAPAAVIAAIRAGLPASVTPGGGSSGGADQNASFEYPVIDPGRLGLRQLVVDAGGTTDGRGTVVRIDAEVQSIAERLPDQAIPAAARVVDIARPAKTSPPGLSPPGRRLRAPAVSLTVIRPAQVTALVRDVDGLPFAGNLRGVSFSCPAFGSFGPIVTFTFRATAGGPALATVRVEGATPTTIDPCATSSLVVAGRRQPALMDGGVLLHRADALLGVTLTTRF